ncbi:class I SAM-dependent methyltransferase [Anoxynatronum sibiricum]|uniref:Class I SAM-dependent methyltransferase n=1 Tax=Anoxynatronum sibiricum TaxID=210623 RepID=A0ABU9VPF1_9CLOT
MSAGDSLYDLLMRPLEKRLLEKVRRSLMVRPRGMVLEIGVGTGANLPYYRYEYIDHLDLLDLTIGEKVRRHHYPDHLPLRFLEGQAEALPFADESYDFVVVSLVLCSVTDVMGSLAEIFRVLKPGGRFIFIEHVLPENQRLKNVFQRLTPLWKRMANQCHLNRETLDAIAATGFEQLELYPVYRDIFIGGVAHRPH